MKTKRITAIITLFIISLSGLYAQSAPDVEIRAEIANGTGGNFLIRLEYNFPEGFHQTLQQDFFNFMISSPPELSIGKISYPEGKNKGELINYYGKTVLEAPLLGFSPDKQKDVMVKASWQLCNEQGMCLFPQSKEIKAGHNYKAEAKERTSSNILFFLLLSFLGGLLLNVMPCVLPVLSIKALSLVKQGGENRKQILGSSMVYSAGVIISLLALAVVIIIIKSSGEQVGWGFQFQNKAFVLSLLTIIFIFALSLFEVFTISAPVMKTGTVTTNGKTSAGSHFFSGVIAVLLATPCTAPFLGTAAGFAFSQSAPVILAVFFMTGLGLSFPFILIGFFPAVVSKMPKPGAWMNTFREIMGFLLIGTSVWLIDVLTYQSTEGFLSRVLIYLTAVAVACWIYGKFTAPGASTRKRITGLIIGAILIAGSAFIFLAPAVETSDTAVNEKQAGSEWSGWIEFSPETAIEKIGGERPVFLAFGAKWCMTCRTNEGTVLFTDEAENFFKEQNAILIHGDYTNKNPEINKWMNQYGRAGVPFYLWYPSGSAEGILLPEIISKKTITGLSN